jgi:hypothetical protein
MTFKPSDFFIGVTDFFSIICPGALLTFFLLGQLEVKNINLTGIFPAITSDTQKVLIFLLTTYIVGNLIFPIAAVLDKYVYDKIRHMPWFKKNFDVCYLKATEIREQYLQSPAWINSHLNSERMKAADKKGLAATEDHNKYIINTYKWSQHFIALKRPDLLNEVKRLEADSKFFRSLVIVFLLMCILIITTAPLHASAFLFLGLLSLYRSADMRYKAAERAYELVIAIETEKKG